MIEDHPRGLLARSEVFVIEEPLLALVFSLFEFEDPLIQVIVFVVGTPLILLVFVFDGQVGDLLKQILIDLHLIGELVGNPRVEAIPLDQDHLDLFDFTASRFMPLLFFINHCIQFAILQTLQS